MFACVAKVVPNNGNDAINNAWSLGIGNELKICGGLILILCDQRPFNISLFPLEMEIEGPLLAG